MQLQGGGGVGQTRKKRKKTFFALVARWYNEVHTQRQRRRFAESQVEDISIARHLWYEYVHALRDGDEKKNEEHNEFSVAGCQDRVGEAGTEFDLNRQFVYIIVHRGFPATTFWKGWKKKLKIVFQDEERDWQEVYARVRETLVVDDMYMFMCVYIFAQVLI
jgi:hypothetical protein